jgi:NTP pyrophosphatase (non-canonical NTP hydrolase)
MPSTIAELIRAQRNFDARHGLGGKSWAQQIDQQHVSVLLELTVALTGEVGEFANVTKKIARGDFTLESGKPELRSELADIFVYLLKLAGQLGIDLEAEYENKMRLNEERFKRFVKRQ